MVGLDLARLNIAVATGVVAATLAGAGPGAGAEACSEQTQSALAPFVGEWSF